MKSLPAAALVLILASAHLSSAASIVLAPTKDNTIYSENDNSNALGGDFFAGENSKGFIRRALLAFDLSSIPADATITSVSLDLYATASAGGTVSLSLHCLTANWGEGTSNADTQVGGGGKGTSCTPGDATWTDAFHVGAAWTNLGGDYVDTTSASTSVSGTGATYTWASTPQMIADVQGWVANSSTNFGWILLGDESTTSTAKGFASREATTTSQRPQLTITYTVAVPEPATQALAFFAVLFLGGNALSQRVSFAKAVRRAGC